MSGDNSTHRKGARTAGMIAGAVFVGVGLLAWGNLDHLFARYHHWRIETPEAKIDLSDEFAALESLGPAGESALIDLLRSESPYVRYRAARSLEVFTSTRAIPFLVELLDDKKTAFQSTIRVNRKTIMKNHPVREAAARALLKIGSYPVNLQSTLDDILNGDN